MAKARKNKNNQRLKAYTLLLINVLCWGAALVIVKPSYAHTTPIRFLLYRYFFASILGTPILFYWYQKFWQKQNKPTKKNFALKFILLELLGTTFVLYSLYSGLKHTSAIEASLLVSATPIFTVLAGILLLKEKEEGHEGLGLLLSFLGTVLLVVWPLLKGHQLKQEISFLGNTMIFAHNIGIALYYVIAKKHYKKVPKFFISCLSFYIGFLSFLVLALAEINFDYGQIISLARTELIQPSVLVASLYMAIFGSIIGLTAYIKGQEYIEASEASLFSYLQPAVYLPLGIIWLKEKIEVYQLIALAIILFGVWIAEKRKQES